MQRCRGDDNRRRFAIQLCVLRHYGAFLDSYAGVPVRILNHLNRQFGCNPFLRCRNRIAKLPKAGTSGASASTSISALLLVCFLSEARKSLLDHLVAMHDRFMTTLARRSRHAFDERHREFRKRARRGIEVVLSAMEILLDRKRITGILDQIRAAGHEVADEHLARVSPLMHAHVIPNGTYRFERDDVRTNLTDA